MNKFTLKYQGKKSKYKVMDNEFMPDHIEFVTESISNCYRGKKHHGFYTVFNFVTKKKDNFTTWSFQFYCGGKMGEPCLEIYRNGEPYFSGYDDMTEIVCEQFFIEIYNVPFDYILSPAMSFLKTSQFTVNGECRAAVSSSDTFIIDSLLYPYSLEYHENRTDCRSWCMECYSNGDNCLRYQKCTCENPSHYWDNEKGLYRIREGHICRICQKKKNDWKKYFLPENLKNEIESKGWTMV